MCTLHNIKVFNKNIPQMILLKKIYSEYVQVLCLYKSCTDEE